MVALLAGRLHVPLDDGGGALATALMGGIVMDTATFAHPNATPRTLAVSAALVAAGAPLSEISRRLYRSKPDGQLRLFGRVLDRLESSPDKRVVWSTIRDADFAETGTVAAHSEGIIDLVSQAEGAEVAIVFKEQGSATRISVRTRPGGVDATVLTGLFGGGGHARRGRRDRPAAPRRSARRGPRRGPASRGRRRCPSLSDARTSSHARAGSGLEGILVLAKPPGPTSHDMVSLVRRISATRRVGHGGTLDPFASGVLPLFLGRATRVVEYHLGDAVLPRDGVLRGVVHDRRPRGRADARARPGARPVERRGGPRGVPGDRSSRRRRPTRRSRSPAGGPMPSHGRAARSSCARGP